MTFSKTIQSVFTWGLLLSLLLIFIFWGINLNFQLHPVNKKVDNNQHLIVRFSKLGTALQKMEEIATSALHGNMPVEQDMDWVILKVTAKAYIDTIRSQHSSNTQTFTAANKLDTLLGQLVGIYTDISKADSSTDQLRELGNQIAYIQQENRNIIRNNLNNIRDIQDGLKARLLSYWHQLTAISIISIFLGILICILVLFIRGRILENIRIKEALEESEEYFRSLFTNSPDAIMIIDGAGKIMDLNPITCELTGFSQQEISGQPLGKMLTPRTTPNINGNPLQQLLSGELQVAEGIAKTKSGNIVLAEVKARQIKYMGKKAVLLHLRDITKRIETEQDLLHAKTDLEERVKERTADLENSNLLLQEEIKQRKVMEKLLASQADELSRSNAELENFAFVASHDLQEPIRTITSFVQLLEHRYSHQLDDNAREIISYAVKGAKRMQLLIHDLLEYSRVRHSKPVFSPVNINEVIANVRQNLQNKIRESKAAFEMNALPKIMADNSQMHQLFQNLLENAIKFRQENRHLQITIGCEERKNEWLFSVSDNGIGISEEYQQKVFIIFQRLHPHHIYEGTGLGLATCKKIIERHQGKIWIQSKEGQGATFYFTIPKDPTKKPIADTHHLPFTENKLAEMGEKTTLT